MRAEGRRVRGDGSLTETLFNENGECNWKETYVGFEKKRPKIIESQDGCKATRAGERKVGGRREEEINIRQIWNKRGEDGLHGI